MSDTQHADLDAQFAQYAADLGQLIEDHERLSASFRQLEALHQESLAISDSERTEASRNLRDALVQADSARLAKRAILSNMSHELRTPLNAILGFSLIARRQASEPAVRNALDQIERAGNRLLALVSDMLDTANIDAGRLQVEAVVFSPQDLLGALSSRFGRVAGEKGLDLRLDLDPQLPTALRGDPLRLGQILRNFVINAIKFSSRGDVIVRAGLVRASAGNADVLFEVQDQGIGIELAAQSRLFQLFEQADASTTRRFDGVGLGLALCKMLAHLMGGQIGFNSDPGKGSLFWVSLRLPIAAQPTADLPPTGGNARQATQALNELCDLVLHGDFRALEVLAKSRALIKPALGAREADVVAAIEAFNFDEALRLIRDQAGQ